MKLLVMGYARHGKDTVCEILRDDYGLSFVSSSYAALDVIFPALRCVLGYTDKAAAYDGRHKHRTLWYRLIKAYNTPDCARLARHIFEQCDVYCGIRNREEFLAAKVAKLFDVAIWVDASKRRPPEPGASCTVDPGDADYILDNNGGKLELRHNIEVMMESFIVQKALLSDALENWLNKRGNKRGYRRAVEKVSYLSDKPACARSVSTPGITVLYND